MNLKVLYIGDNGRVDYPLVMRGEWIIPDNWYVLDRELTNRPDEIYNIQGEIIKILEHFQILQQFDSKEFRVSVIKTDKNLLIDEVLITQ